MVLINRWWCRVACILKGRKVQSSWNKFRTPVFRFGLFETTDALTFSFDKFTTNAINLFKLLSITSDCLTVWLNLTRSDALLQPCLFPDKVKLDDDMQDGDVIKTAALLLDFLAIISNGKEAIWRLKLCGVFYLCIRFFRWKEKEYFSGPY